MERDDERARATTILWLLNTAFADIWYIRAEGRTDPSKCLLDVLRQRGFDARPYSRIREGGHSHRVVCNIDSIRWQDEDHCEVTAGFKHVPGSGVGTVYHLEREGDDRWRVVPGRRLWLAD
jgi:hypothetical protein